MGITAHSAVCCFDLTAPPGATVRIMCLSSMNLGPLTWRPSFFGVACPHSLGAVGGQKAPKRDGDHGSPCPVLVISTQSKKGHAMIPAVFALGLATGIALTTAFALGLLPLLYLSNSKSLH